MACPGFTSTIKESLKVCSDKIYCPLYIYIVAVFADEKNLHYPSSTFDFKLYHA